MVCFHTVKEKDAKFKRFQFVCKEICNRISLCVCRPSTGKGISARRLQSNRLCERAIAQESLNTSYMKLSCKTIAFIGGVGGLPMMTSHSGTLCSAPPTKFGLYTYGENGHKMIIVVASIGRIKSCLNCGVSLCINMVKKLKRI